MTSTFTPEAVALLESAPPDVQQAIINLALVQSPHCGVYGTPAARPYYTDAQWRPDWDNNAESIFTSESAGVGDGA